MSIIKDENGVNIYLATLDPNLINYYPQTIDGYTRSILIAESGTLYNDALKTRGTALNATIGRITFSNGNYVQCYAGSTYFYRANGTTVNYINVGNTGYVNYGQEVNIVEFYNGSEWVYTFGYLEDQPDPSTLVSYTIYATSTDKNLLLQWINGIDIDITVFPGNPSGIGGGGGSFSTTSDDISIPSLPTLSAVSAGFITLFAPSTAQLNSLAAFMWSSSFDLDTFKKLFADPMDAIIGLSIVPVAVPVSGSSSVKIGFIDTGVSMNLASSQYATINCGTLTPAEYWGSALDYSPYTKFSIHLPYIGTRELNTDDIMGKAIQVVYNIDILSGACTAMIKCGGSVLYEFSGACATSIPVTGQNWTQLITSCIQLAGAGIAVAASGGSAAGLLPSTANAVMAMKPNIQRTGAVSGSAGMLGVQQPYLIWELPRQSLAKNYNKFVGYPSNITALLSTLTGYTQIESVHLKNIPASQTELAEIETLLKEGVII
jgi:hypothetical protein